MGLSRDTSNEPVLGRDRSLLARGLMTCGAEVREAVH